MKCKFILAVSFLALALVSCGNSQKQAETQVAATGQQTAVADYCGTYQGVLPCADCEGIKTTLVIRNDCTYDLKSEYLGKDEGVFETSGVYNMKQSDLIELVTPSSGAKTYYKISKNTLLRTDSIGQNYLGDTAEYYKLTKK